MTELETLIFESKMRGVWAGYIREKYSEDAISELLDSGHFVKIKTMDSLYNNYQGVPMWAIVKKGFDRSLIRR